MVKIINLEEVEANGTTEEHDDGIEVDIGDEPPEEPDHPDAPQSTKAASALEPSVSETGVAPSLIPGSIRQPTPFGPGIIRPSPLDPTRLTPESIRQPTLFGPGIIRPSPLEPIRLTPESIRQPTPFGPGTIRPSPLDPTRLTPESIRQPSPFGPSIIRPSPLEPTRLTPETIRQPTPFGPGIIRPSPLDPTRLTPESIRQPTPFGPGIIRPATSESSRYLWNIIAQYGHCVEVRRSLHGHRQTPIRTSGPGRLAWWAINLNPAFAATATQSSATSETNLKHKKATERSGTGVAPTQTASYAPEGMRREGKVHSDKSTEEKSNVATANVTRRAPSTNLSDHELTDFLESQAIQEYDTVKIELNADYKRTRENQYKSSLMSCPWTSLRDTYMKEVEPELTDSTDGGEPSDCSDEGEAACLPSRIQKDCWQEWVDDNTLFNMDVDVTEPASSAGGVRTPSPPSPTTQRRRVKMENRRRARERERAVKPVERYIFVPTEKIGRILGKGGRRIREIEQATGTNIKVEHRRSNKPVTQLTITGTEAQINKADEEICIIIRNFKPPKAGEPATVPVSASSQEEMELKRLLLGIKAQVIDAEKGMP